MKPKFFSLITSVLILFGLYWSAINLNLNPKYKIGDGIDEFNGVKVFYNGGVGNVTERNLSTNGYNLGLKYQCVEFVKRYYFKFLDHRMPDSYGHAKDFFDNELSDGAINKKRNLLQFKNPSFEKPLVSDLIVFKPTLTNRFGHVAIISKVLDQEIEIIQQNPGPFSKSRIKLTLVKKKNGWLVKGKNTFGWLRKKSDAKYE